MNDFFGIEDKRKWEEKFDKQYVLKQQIGVGQRTVVYKMIKCDNKEEYVLLLPKEFLSFERKQKFKSFFETIIKMQQFCTDGYQGNIFIPEVQLFDGFRIQKYAGEVLSQELYNQLTMKQKEKIAKDIAQYLWFVHEKSIKNANNSLFDNEKVKIGQIDAYNYWSSEDMRNDILCWNNFLTTADRAALDKLISDYECRDKSDEIAVLTHGDLRFQNMLYDKEKKRLAIIDYELCHVRSLYRDLCPFCHSGLNENLIGAIVKNYNDCANQLKLNIEKVKLFSNIAALAECSRCSRMRPQMAKTLWNEFKQMYLSF